MTRFFCSTSYILWIVVSTRLSGLRPGLKAESAQPVRMMSVSNWDRALLAEPRDWQLITTTLNSSALQERLLLHRLVSLPLTSAPHDPRAAAICVRFMSSSRQLVPGIHPSGYKSPSGGVLDTSPHAQTMLVPERDTPLCISRTHPHFKSLQSLLWFAIIKCCKNRK